MPATPATPDEPSQSPRPPAGLPWAGRPRRADLVCWLGIMVSGLYALVLIPVRPVLIGRDPVLLELLTGSMTSIVSAGAFARVGQVSLPVAIAAAVPGMIMFDPFYWWAGRLWGRGMLEVVAGRRRRGRRLIERSERIGRRFGPPAVVLAYFLPVPAMLLFVVAGWTGMRLATFVVFDAVGAVLWIGLLAGLGFFLGNDAVQVARTVSAYSLWLTLALVVLIAVMQMRRARQAAG